LIKEKNIILTSGRIIEILERETICMVSAVQSGKPRTFFSNFDFTYSNGCLIIYIVCAENQRTIDWINDGDEVNIRVIQILDGSEWISVSIVGVAESGGQMRNVVDFQKHGRCRRLSREEGKPVLRVKGVSMRGRFYEVARMR